MLESQEWEQLPIILSGHWNKQMEIQTWMNWQNNVRKILNTEYSDKLDELYRLGGTSGGARPKIMTTIDEEEWIIKFPTHVDGKNAGKWNMIIHVVRKKVGLQ